MVALRYAALALAIISTASASIATATVAINASTKYAYVEALINPTGRLAPSFQIVAPQAILEQVTAQAGVVPGIDLSYDQPICTYSVIVSQASEYLTEKMGFINPTSAQNSFAALLYSIHRIADKVAHGYPYDDAYDTREVLLTHSTDNNVESRQLKLFFLSRLALITGEIKQYVDLALTRRNGLYDVDNLISCDKQVSAVVRSRPDLTTQTELLVEFGKLCAIYITELQKTFDDVTDNQLEFRFLANGKNLLRPFILQNAVVYKILDSLIQST